MSGGQVLCSLGCKKRYCFGCALKVLLGVVCISVAQCCVGIWVSYYEILVD